VDPEGILIEVDLVVISAVAEADSAAVAVVVSAVAAVAVVLAVAVVAVSDQGKCTKQPAQIVVQNVKYHSSQKKTDQYIAGNVSRSISLKGSESG
jgi:hypothetical protein